MKAIFDKINDLFAEDANIGQILADIAALIMEKIFGFVKESEGYVEVEAE